MHRAPAVNFSVGRSRWHLRGIALFSFLALASTVVFVYDQMQPDWRSALLASATLVVSALAIKAWQKSPQGHLRWDGQRWHWSGFADGQECRLALRVDFQKVMLVALYGAAARPLWLWLEAAHGDVHWLPLRRAVVSSQGRGGNAAIDKLSDLGEVP